MADKLARILRCNYENGFTSTCRDGKTNYHSQEFNFDRGKARETFLDHLQNLILRKNGKDGDYWQRILL